MPLVIGTSLATRVRLHIHMCWRFRLTKIHCARWLRVQGVVAGRWVTGRPAAAGAGGGAEDEGADPDDPGARPAGRAESAPSLSAEQPESSTAATATTAATAA